MQVHPDPAPPSPVENLRWLEDQLDVTYSPMCCSYNAGTTTLLLRLPNATGGNGEDCSSHAVGGPHGPIEFFGWQRDGSGEQNLVDIFGRIQELDPVQPERQAGYWGVEHGGLVDLKMPHGQQPYTIQQGSAGALAQIEEIVDSCAEDGTSNEEHSESALTPAEFKQSEEAYSLRSFINTCLMLPGSRRLSGGRRKKVEADARLTHGADAPYNRGLQFLQWRGRFPKAASAGSPSQGATGSPGRGEGDKMNCSHGRGGHANEQHEASMAREKVRQASRLLSLRRKNKHGSADSGLANGASTLSVTSIS